jgi:hypothetical protein
MWGQGLPRNKRFAQLFTAALRTKVGTPGRIVWDFSRSGAEIRADGDQRLRFADVYPHLFPNRRGLAPFLEGTNDSPAHDLYGEVPSTFPTVRGQVRLCPIALGREVDIALLDGGINDLGIEDIINPIVHDGTWIEWYEGIIRKTARDVVLMLLGDVRKKCPNAVILYFGLFPVVSFESDNEALRDAFKFQLDDDVRWYFNQVFGCKNVNAAIGQSMTRGEWFFNRWSYWSKQAVVRANRNPSMRGPGLVYVPSGFTTENAGFGPTPFLFTDYLDPSNDPVRDTRVDAIPRQDQRGLLVLLHSELATALGPHNLNPQMPGPNYRRWVRELFPNLDGPLSMRSHIRSLNELLDEADRLNTGLTPEIVDAMVLLERDSEAEIARINRGLIASTGHPNVPGARSYANSAIKRYIEHLVNMNRANIESGTHDPTPPVVVSARGALRAALRIPSGTTLDDTLRRYRLRDPGPVHGDLEHLQVDSLGIRASTAPNSDRLFDAMFFLYVAVDNEQGGEMLHRYCLSFRPYLGFKWYPHFEPSTDDALAVDTAGLLPLTRVLGISLYIGGPPGKINRLGFPYGRFWRPEGVALEVNGEVVSELDLQGQTFSPHSIIDLRYPEAHRIQPPRRPVKPIDTRRVRPIPRTLPSGRPTPTSPLTPPPLSDRPDSVP